MNKKRYSWSFIENSTFESYYETIEECLREARENNEDNEMIVFIGEAAECDVSFDCERLIEDIQSQAYSEIGEIAEDYLAHVTNEQESELEETVREVCEKWIKKHHLELGYITEIEKYNLETGEKITHDQI